jgi:hypothetical protein
MAAEINNNLSPGNPSGSYPISAGSSFSSSAASDTTRPWTPSSSVGTSPSPPLSQHCQSHSKPSCSPPPAAPVNMAAPSQTYMPANPPPYQTYQTYQSQQPPQQQQSPEANLYPAPLRRHRQESTGSVYRDAHGRVSWATLQTGSALGTVRYRTGHQDYPMMNPYTGEAGEAGRQGSTVVPVALAVGGPQRNMMAELEG